jgi:hypothetical protein
MEFSDLFCEKFEIPAGSQSIDFKSVLVAPDNVESVGSDGARRTEKSDFFQLMDFITELSL